MTTAGNLMWRLPALNVNSALASLSQTDPRFKLAYEDRVAMVFENRR